MIVISYDNGEDKVWEIGEERFWVDMDRVTMLYADFEELDRIATMFPALTPQGILAGNWYGDLAKTILHSVLYGQSKGGGTQ